ncbi:hypothetical protein [Paenibacillus donghaensis]|nr:hypothetical protein [Paenibacillus donghaensis]
MIALFLAQRVILGKLAFSAVPTEALKTQVKVILTDSGLEFLAV